MKHIIYFLLFSVVAIAAKSQETKKDIKEELKNTMIADIPDRQVDAGDVQVPAGYTVSVVAQGFTFPTAATFDDQGNLYVTEAGYSYGGDLMTPKLIRVGANGDKTTIATGEKNGPWTGVTYYKGNFYIAEGGRNKSGRLLKVAPNGSITALVNNLPSMGDHFTEGPAIGPDGYVYFSTGTATNSAVVGEDNYNRSLALNDIHMC